MFYALAVGSMLGYALQHALLVHYARKIDGLSLAFYRGISFTVTLAPLLIGATTTDIMGVLTHWRLLLLAGFSGGTYLALNFGAYRLAPVGMVQTITRAFGTISMALVGWTFFGEILSPARIALIVLIIAGCLWLGLQKSSHAHLTGSVFSGIVMAVACALPLSVTHAVLAALTHRENPLVSGYLWELSIALACGVLLIGRGAFFRQHVQRIRCRTFLRIAVFSSPTLIGTGLYSLALMMGPLSVVSAIGGGSLVVMTLLAWWWYGERLRTMQWMAIAVVLAGIVGLKFV